MQLATKGHQGGPGVTASRSIHTKSLHGIVQGVCILAGIEAWEVLHRAPVNLGGKKQGDAGGGQPVTCASEGGKRN